MRARITGFFHRVAYASLLAVAVFNLAVLPLGLGYSRALGALLDTANSPVSLAGLALPCSERGLEFPFGNCHHQGGQTAPESFFNHLRLAIPVYVLIFYLPSLFVVARNRWRGRVKAVSAIAMVLALGFSASPAIGAERGPSTPDERAQAVRLVRALEDDSLNKDARAARQWVLAWLTEIPDISVEMCPALFGEKFKVSKKYAGELALQQSFSGAVFIIEHPDQAADALAVALAGVEGALKAYESLLLAEPKAHFPSLDALLEARTHGRLGEQVAANLKAYR